MNGEDKIFFEWMGWQLQEPMALVTNWMIAAFCFFAWIRLRKWSDKANYWWSLFFLMFGISTFFGGLGHLLFRYFDVYGKFPCWTFGTVANICAAIGVLELKPFSEPVPYAKWIAIVKSLILLTLAVVTQKFIFIAVDAILTYIAYTGVYAFLLKNRGLAELNKMIIGVVILLPSAFIFLGKINPHRWLNKDDLSHILMLGCIIFFYRSMNAWGNRITQNTAHV